MNIDDKLREHFISVSSRRLHKALEREDMILPEEAQCIIAENHYIVHVNGDASKNYKFLQRLQQAIDGGGRISFLYTNDSRISIPLRCARIRTMEPYDSRLNFYGKLRAIIAKIAKPSESRFI